MAKRRAVGNPLALAVLSGLLLEPMHPYEMGRRLKETGKDRNIKYNRGSLYMVVEQLAKAGFIAEQETVRDTARPERTVYALTGTGRAELYDWMRELVAEPEHEYPRFGVALSLLGVLDPAEAVELLGRRVVALDREAAEITADTARAKEQGVLWVFLVEEDYRLALLDAERRFVTALIDGLTAPEYVRAWQDAFGEGKPWSGEQ
ncbi:PadR family transcriptional regulator [Actinokineospora globicatena]|uniref:PadR family transcriptional regulator n=1 Tax=Actinokineospora globicatena TaxID=103729 RepID=A0A9W6V8M9_9PSEU|nr:PadR family transcriptional regulator [Actinokineospora globicatena]MCP2304684.1 DNA-binding transcriptional regulator, PadR family [Actinokineospora globicatena]GLW77941.1 PadR family transcriptional regulator [Actinokineospora globicatena]GLW85392.1 PadR family transcriptional regulator [Actinokineospora globicatena]GLW94145.1 PadR family transcriptional regulator [Actinokineospora globicatena]